MFLTDACREVRGHRQLLWQVIIPENEFSVVSRRCGSCQQKELIQTRTVKLGVLGTLQTVANGVVLFVGSGLCR